ncbi:MAG: 1-acyl-sn-glycerol-3-phosphate acyltransferase [Bacteroidota bacterium]
MKWLAKLILKLTGWTIDYNIPKEAQRSVMIAAPHTTNWDALYTRLAFFVLGIPVKIAIKDYWTRFPFSLLIVPLGGLGIDRRKREAGEKRISQTDQMAAFFEQFERIALVIAPEGSRSLRKEWKMGFYYTAQKANVPITFGYLDYSTRTAGVGGPVYPSDDMEADMQKIMDFYKKIEGKYPENFSLDQRYE